MTLILSGGFLPEYEFEHELFIANKWYFRSAM